MDFLRKHRDVIHFGVSESHLRMGPSTADWVILADVPLTANLPHYIKQLIKHNIALQWLINTRLLYITAMTSAFQCISIFKQTILLRTLIESSTPFSQSVLLFFNPPATFLYQVHLLWFHFTFSEFVHPWLLMHYTYVLQGTQIHYKS